ncbi:hypothetical protein RY831_32565 [Noviherbaspirillum sp. CPCC 100848]|uniref:CdiI immunity protein domain-containing protein n=1 Tax=Noviherbaspirillum album TaxID=3080276 RepID=A0ABU6JJK8_9BURK|nr:hypothetical protein [Noviherbaspirillum sp. CPCC 100848]MEC4723844.1 hypothetical protein [Noviherbaspirillum sp. CPCC 100848]
MESIIWPLLFKFQPEQYLEEITDMLEGDYILNTQDFTEKRTNEEIRSYLKELSVRIEDEFPSVARSGHKVRMAGLWQCLNCDDERVIRCEVGDLLPTDQTRTRVWKLQPVKTPQSGMDVLTLELCSFYTKKSMRNSFSVSDPEEYAIETASRLVSSLTKARCKEVIDLLHHLQNNPNDPHFRILDEKSGIHWPGSRESWNFFEQWCSLVASQLDESIG